MTSILHIQSSSNLASSHSRNIGGKLVATLRDAHPDATVVERDLASHPIPHLGPDALGQMFSGNFPLSDQLIDELSKSDVLVIEAPMYNFGIPSVLKAWIDHVARAGKTFRYTENGPVGLLTGKKAYLVLASGGIYSEGPAATMEHQGSYLRALLGFLGITDVEIIRAEGVALGADKAAQALAHAEREVAELGKRVA